MCRPTLGISGGAQRRPLPLLGGDVLIATARERHSVLKYVAI
jgi:hypothetical protein